MSVNISEKYYLDGWHCNIPTQDTWNNSVKSGIHEIYKQLQIMTPHTDIQELTIQPISGLKEYGGEGDIGYDYLSENNIKTGYYYVEFTLMTEHEEQVEAYKAINNELNLYLDREKEYQLASNKYRNNINDDGESLLTMRAYFIAIG